MVQKEILTFLKVHLHPSGKVYYHKSFLSYSYLLYKMMELLVSMDFIKETDFKNHLSMMRSVEKLNNNDRYWKVICERYSWKFYKSDVELKNYLH